MVSSNSIFQAVLFQQYSANLSLQLAVINHALAGATYHASRSGAWCNMRPARAHAPFVQASVPQSSSRNCPRSPSFGALKARSPDELLISLPFFWQTPVFTTQNMTTTCVPSFFCPRSRKTSEVAVHRALGLYMSAKAV